MSDNDYKGLANILRINPVKKKTPVDIPKEDEDAIEEFFVPTRDETIWPSLRYLDEKKNK